MGVSALFSKIAGRKKGKIITMDFGDVIIRAIMSAPKCLQTGSLLVMVRQLQNTWLFLFNKLISVKFGLSNSTTFATVICQHFGMAD